MKTLVYVGPGRKDDPRKMRVSDHEVEPLLKTGVWEVVGKKATSSAQSEGADNG